MRYLRMRFMMTRAIVCGSSKTKTKTSAIIQFPVVAYLDLMKEK